MSIWLIGLIAYFLLGIGLTIFYILKSEGQPLRDLYKSWAVILIGGLLWLPLLVCAWAIGQMWAAGDK